MAKQKDKTIYWIGGAVLLWWLLKSKKGKELLNTVAPGAGLTALEKNAIKSNIKQDLRNLDIKPILDREQDFAAQYKDDLNNCKY
jgi:hypothetical protein